MALFTVENLTFSYPGQTARAIDSLSLTVPEGAFLVLCGPSGCGKSTLLRQLKPALAPHGTRQGRILFRDTPLDQVDQRTLAARIGFVQQSPENQIVTDKVWHELAFGLESLGVDTPTIRRRVAEMAAFFGIEDWFYRDVSQLSGGQKQLLNLASVMAMQPDVLILDEPTSQLDPIAASDFLAVLGKINRELGTAVVLTEHRLEEAFPLATAVAVMDRGQLLCTGTPYDVGRRLKTLGHRMFLAMPAAMRVWASVETEAPCPVTVREGRDFLRSYAAEHPLVPLPREQTYPRRQPVLTVQGAWFRYEPDSPDVIKGLDLTLGRGEFLALLGGNGAGKSTTLKLLSGMKKPQRGDISVKGTLGMLPQNPQTLFVKKTVREDLFEIFSGTKTPRPQQEERVARMVALCRLEDLLDRHPYDLSGGEQQRAALAKVLLLEPEILLLDEPTKGLDAEFKQAFALILRTLLARGVSLLMVSHDVEFCARYAHRCALFFDGSVSPRLLLRQQLLHHRRQPHGPEPGAPGGDGGGRHGCLRRHGSCGAGPAGGHSPSAGAPGGNAGLEAQKAAPVAQGPGRLVRGGGPGHIPVCHRSHGPVRRRGQGRPDGSGLAAAAAVSGVLRAAAGAGPVHRPPDQAP